MYLSSIQKLQATIAQVLHRLNQETILMETITQAAPVNCCVEFEFGVADADTFSYLDGEELKKLETALRQEALRVLDVFCIARYHVMQANGKRRSLKFDYAMFRFAFKEDIMELLMHHQRGIQRIPLKDLISFLANQINRSLSEKGQEILVIRNSHTF